ncbi:Na+/H+ antiporter NhaA [Psychromonas sp. MB-3u-54]|uniref:Na+/H+ antiporter NhaA n=1 Tax=Psychromonas sp. MB-3u-54 TaxID=2058319 RepID=UPI001E476A37|nr:Na+/H+ antiporter NhaA [Psychromonas sp. MB-3u-54]
MYNELYCTVVLITPFSNFIRAQATASLFLLLATWWNNSDYSSTYQTLTHMQIGFFLSDIELQASLKHVINDGLMIIFFFFIGLEKTRSARRGSRYQRKPAQIFFNLIF